jgi:putative flippase GtrA
MSPVSKIKHWVHQHQIFKQAPRFLLVGLCSTIIGYSVFLICLRFFDLHYLIANIGGFVFGTGFSYYCNRRWTFNSSNSSYFFRYFSFYLSSLILSSILLKIIVEFIGIKPELANLLTIPITTCVNFLGLKFLVFKK